MKMNHAVKGVLLGLALSLCLLLTGCYIAPDDVNNTTVTTGSSLVFPTLAPTETVVATPDTIVVETQNIFGINGIAVTNSAPTPTPTVGGAGGWNDWGTVQQTGGATAPAEMTPTPTPTLGGTIILGQGTLPPGETATPAGIAVITEAPVTAPPVTKVPIVTPTPTPPSLQVGFKGSEAVRALQRRLKELGYYSGSADGDFGPATEKAVMEFQRANGLKADGKAGQQTLSKLNSRSAISYKEAHATATPRVTAKPTPRVTATPRPTATPNLSKDYYLSAGASGARVRTLQGRLIELGWLGGKVTGTYDEATEAAVRAFQKKTKGLYEDGVAGPGTLQALYSDGAARSGTVAASSGETLELGSEGAEVRALQTRLRSLGYLSGSVDGSFGVATEAAVIAFQKQNGLTADGKAGNATLNRIYSDSAVKSGGGAAKLNPASSGSHDGGRDTSDIVTTGYETLELDSEGAGVRRLQQRLKELGYYTGSVDGKFGEGTSAAVMAFQLTNNLTVDGKAGPATQRVLYGSKNAITYSALRVGETGSAVRSLQYTLYELGYYDGSIDGDYGQTTSDAVRAFQIQNGLTPVDGVAGSNTLGRLYSSDAVPASAAEVDYGSIRLGDRGDKVVQVQDCLMQMGYLDGINGVYDEATMDAVKAFQRDNGLTADGVAGSRTLQILFGY